MKNKTKFEKKYIRGVEGREEDVLKELTGPAEGKQFVNISDKELLGSPAHLFYVQGGDIVCVDETSTHGRLLKAACEEVFLAPIWKTPLTESEKKLVDKIGDYIEENYGEIGTKISHEIKKMKNFCRCTECKHRSIYYGLYPDMESKRIICEKSEKTNKELSYEESNGSVGDCCDYESI